MMTMRNNMNEQLNAKSIVSKYDFMYIVTTNKINKNKGVASFYTNGEDKIFVFEGSSDGSDDAG